MQWNGDGVVGGQHGNSRRGRRWPARNQRERRLFDLQRLGQPQHLKGASAVRQAADEGAFFQRVDQPMHTGFGLQVQRFLHFLEGRRHAVGLQPLIDENEQFLLLTGEHLFHSHAAKTEHGKNI